VRKVIEVTNGYKTKFAALLYLLITAFGDSVPFIENNKEILVNILDLLIASGLFHDFWRNRKKIIEFIKDFLKKQS
jgi:hypothetical protein